MILFGGGGHGRAVADVLERQRITIEAVVDPTGPEWGAIPLIADDRDGVNQCVATGTPAVIAVGDNRIRLDLARLLLAGNVELPTIIATSATVSATARLDAGVVVLEHAHIGPHASLDVGSVVNTGAVVEHGARLGAATHIGPGAILAGDVTCGERCLVGAGAVVTPGVTIGDHAVVGAGAVVVRAVPSGVTVVGNPASER